MNELNVSSLIRGTTRRYLPSIELRKLPGNRYSLTTSWVTRITQSTFELGKEFDERTFDRRSVKSVITFEGNKMIHKQGGTPPVSIIREFNGDELIETITVNDVVTTLKYNADRKLSVGDILSKL